MKVAIISDVHSNIFALEAVYSDLEKEKIDKILVIGDLIGYYYWPKEVLDLLMNDKRVSCIRGNHEEILAEVIADKSTADNYRKKYGSGYDACINDLSGTEIDWLINLPKHLVLNIHGSTFYLSHGGLDSVNDYIYPDAKYDILQENYSNEQFTIFGNTHYAFAHYSNGKYLLNPGSVGQPRDIRGLSSYTIINLSNLSIRFKRIYFDTTEVIKKSKSDDPNIAYLWNVLTK